MVVQENHHQDLSTPLKNDKKHRLKQRFDVQKKLGQGTYGKVQLAVIRETGQEVAIKTIKKIKIENEQDLIRIRREIQIMSSIQHPHLIHIYEVFENKDKIVLVMQFASGGELYDYLSEKKVLSDTEARRIFRQIAAAVYYCHKNKICHRDLKLENILLDEKGNAKIADFGLSNVFDERHLLKTYCGSPLYASPEIVKGVPYYGPEVDCWSMGVLLYTLVYGAMPFDGTNFKKLVTQISEGDYFEPKKKSKASSLIQKLLTVNPVKRATIVDICTDWWVNQGYEHSLLQVAEDMANLTPVRLDLLLALAPGSPIPPEDAAFQEQQSAEEGDSDAVPGSSVAEKDIHDDADEDYDDDDDNTATVANSFAYVKGSRSSNRSLSTPNLLEATERLHEEDDDEDEEEFLPADVAAALEGQSAKRERSFDGSLVRASSLAHQDKKTKKSDSKLACKNKVLLGSNKQILSSKTQINQGVQEEEEVADSKYSLKSDSPCVDIDEERHSSEILKEKSKTDLPATDSLLQNVRSLNENNAEFLNLKLLENESKRLVKKERNDEAKHKKEITNKEKAISDCSQESAQEEPYSKTQKRGSLGSFVAQDGNAINDSKKTGRHPGKIIIPKTFSSPQNSPSPKMQGPKSPSGNNSTTGVQSCGKETPETKPSSPIFAGTTSPHILDESLPLKKHDPVATTLNKNIIHKENNVEDKKVVAKGILKKGIAKAKLAERKMSQNSFDSDILTPSTASVGTPDTVPSFLKTPKPYKKEDEQQLKSNAEILLNTAAKSSSNTKSNDPISCKTDSLWGTSTVNSSSDKQIKQLQNKSSEWNTLSSTLDSEMSGWRQQLEESLRKLSPEENERASLAVKNEDDKPLVPIARSYKKFTFTKDGACITETKKVYATPGADGSWTKVEKKTKITTRPGNAEEFEKFRDLHLRNDSPLARSDSQSSSGSTDIYDDIFDSWTGDTMLCNMMKMNNVFQKFSRDPFLRRERRRNPFRQFHRAESERNERERKRPELRSGHSTDKESSENEEDYDVHFDSANPVVYGSQGLWQFLRSTNKGFPGHVTISQRDPEAYSRSVSQDRSESKYGNWKRSDSRNSSGYNTGTRSHSRDRMESPREKVLRFVFESPHQGNEVATSSRSPPSRNDAWSFKRTVSCNPRRDSGVGSDGYESEHSVRRTPSDDVRRSGQVSPLLSAYKPDIFKSFKKPWPKEFVSPAVSPTSVQQDGTFERPDNLAESRRHRVEQWLHMSDINNPNFPFDTNEEFNSHSSCRNSPSVHGNKSSIYGTMRPREYMRYYRSSSDKLADFDFDYFPSFDESQRSRSIHNIHKEGGFSSDGSKMRTAGAVYSPVSEESSRGAHSVHHSDSSHSNSSVHRINFTISDGRVSSSHTPVHSAATFGRSRGSSLDGQVSEDNSGTFRIEKSQARNVGQPIVQMKVSFNRDNRENQVIHLTSQSQLPTSKGLWQQQDKPSKPFNVQNRSPPIREISPLPGIRKFSTEIVHPVSPVGDSKGSPIASNISRTRSSSGEKTEESSFECENNSGKTSPGNPPRGKNGPCSPSLVCDFVHFNACLPPSMESSRTPTNINNGSNDQPSAFANACSTTRLTNKVRNFDLKNLKSSPDTLESIYHPSIHQGANTPDSLEDIGFEDAISELKECSRNVQQGNNGIKTPSSQSPNPVRSNNTFQLEIKPLGVLWDNCKLKAPQDVKKCSKLNSECVSSKAKSSDLRGCFEVGPILPCDNLNESEKNKSFTDPKNAVAFNRKQNQNNIDFLNLLSNDGLDNFRSTVNVLKSSQIDTCKNKNNAPNYWPAGRFENISMDFGDSTLSHSVVNEHLSLIDSLECDDTHKQRLPKIMPSLLDDLQSPKEVLRQAMKLCDAFESYK